MTHAGRRPGPGAGGGLPYYCRASERMGVGSASGRGVRGECFAPVSIITVCERREAKGLDAHVPLILRGDALYDPDLDRFFLDLPLAGIRSRHSLRPYAYDVVVWLRFLDACGQTKWRAAGDDIDGYHRPRRRDEAGHRISADSWNRAVPSTATTRTKVG